MGTAGSGQNYNGIYTGSLLSMGSGWSAAGSAFTTGGSFYTASSTTGNLATTPLGVVDTFVIGYAKLSGGGSFSYNIDGGSNTTVSTNNGSNAAGFTTVTASSPGNHTLNINWVSGTVYVGLVYAYNSANKNVIFLNGGWGGSTTCNNWDNSATSPYGPIGMMAAISPAVTMIDLGINDWGVNTVASVKTCLQDIITKSAGNVILVTPFPSATSVATVSVQQQYINMYYQLADANNIPLIDQYNMFVSNANAVTYGFDYDTKHPNGVGYADESRLLATALLAP